MREEDHDEERSNRDARAELHPPAMLDRQHRHGDGQLQQRQAGEVVGVGVDEVPEGTDPYRKIACLCAVGNIYQAMFSAGVKVDEELPWMREWFMRYQLPDGGLNCDEKVYTKPLPKSSIVTTLSCLEAVLFCRTREITKDEIIFLNSSMAALQRVSTFSGAQGNDILKVEYE